MYTSNFLTSLFLSLSDTHLSSKLEWERKWETDSNEVKKVKTFFRMALLNNTKVTNHLDNGAKLEKSLFKWLSAIYAQDIVNNRKKILHGLSVFLMNLLHHSIQTHATCTPNLCCPSKQAKVACGLNKLQHIVTSEDI